MGLLSISKIKKTALYQIIREIRIRQWLKNGFVFIPLVFGKQLFDMSSFISVLGAFFAFSFIASFVYIINDLKDIEKDRLHPIKKNRPLASGTLSVELGLKVAVLFLSFGLLLSAIIAYYLFYLILFYVFLQLAYTFKLKKYIIIDALTVSFGFIVRLFAGGVAGEVSISSWLILFVIGLSLLLAFGKRRGERTVLSEKNIDLSTRETLKSYPDSLLNSMISMSAAYTIITYSIFTFQTSPNNQTPELIKSLLPSTLQSPKWMMFSIPVMIYIVARYLYVIYESKYAESPERALLSDKPLLVAIGVWGLLIFVFYYILGTVNL